MSSTICIGNLRTILHHLNRSEKHHEHHTSAHLHTWTLLLMDTGPVHGKWQWWCPMLRWQNQQGGTRLNNWLDLLYTYKVLFLQGNTWLNPVYTPRHLSKFVGCEQQRLIFPRPGPSTKTPQDAAILHATPKTPPLTTSRVARVGS